MIVQKHVDFKVTCWCRAHFDDETDMNKVIEMIKAGHGSGTICSIDGFQEWESMQETEEDLPVEENGGACTIEVYETDIDCIWKNAPEM